MKEAEQFNNWDLKDKWNFIKNKIGLRPYGAVNHLLTPDTLYYFQMALFKNELIECFAEDLPPEFKPLLKALGIDDWLINYDDTTEVKQYFYDAAFKSSKKHN